MRSAILGLAASAVLTAAGPAVVIQNANVLTVTRGSFRGSVVIEDGTAWPQPERVSAVRATSLPI